VPYTPARHFAKGKSDPGFRTKLAIGADLAIKAREAGFAFRAVAADSAYGDQDGFRSELAEAGLPFVMALKPRRGTWAYGDDAHTPVDAARDLAWGGPDDPGDWRPGDGVAHAEQIAWYSRRLADRPHECPSHALHVAEAGLAGHHRSRRRLGSRRH